MSTSSNNKSEATMDDVLALISDFKAGNFSKQLNKTSDPKLKDLVDSLNDVTKILAAQAAQAAQVEIEITERKLAEIVLVRSTQLLEESQSIAKLGGWELDLLTGVLYWTAETYRIHDTSPEEFNPTVDAGVGYFLPESKRQISEALELAMTKGMGYDLYLETYTTKGRKIDVRTTCKVTVVDGKPTKLTGGFQDITEQKLFEREKEAILKRLNYALDASGDGIWDWTPADGKMVYSKAWIEMLGYKVGELSPLASEWSDRVHPEDIEQVFATINLITQASENGDTFSHEYRFRNKAGDYLWMLNKGKVVERNVKGEASRVVGTHTNITERKRSEQLMQEARAMAENATIIKSRFLDIAAHELRTPVTSFSLLIQLTQIQLEKGFPFEASVLTKLRAQADKISRLVVDLLDVSRLERGAVTLNLERIDLNSVITECVDDLKLREPDRMIKIIKTETPVELNFDSLRIAQVISNLLENTRKYTPRQSPVEINVVKKPAHVRISITDHGPGVSDEQKTKLFNPFSRGSDELTSRSGGLGLGLYVCSEIIKLHGGSIGVITKMGEGSTFYFELPTGEVK